MPHTRAALTYASDEHSLPLRLAILAIERLSGSRKLEKVYHRVLDAVDTGAPFWGAALKELGCLPVFDEAQLRKIPTDAPVIFIANHPFGILDG